jgi:hypothetical protein
MTINDDKAESRIQNSEEIHIALIKMNSNCFTTNDKRFFNDPMTINDNSMTIVSHTT